VLLICGQPPYLFSLRRLDEVLLVHRFFCCFGGIKLWLKTVLGVLCIFLLVEKSGIFGDIVVHKPAELSTRPVAFYYFMHTTLRLLVSHLQRPVLFFRPWKLLLLLFLPRALWWCGPGLPESPLSSCMGCRSFLSSET